MHIDADQLKSAIRYWIDIKIRGDIDNIEFDEFFRDFNEYWPTLNDETNAYIHFEHADDYPAIPLLQFISMTNQIENAYIDYNIGAAITINEFLFCIECSDYYSVELFGELIRYNKSIISESTNKRKCYWGQTLSFDGNNTTVCLLTGAVTIYHLLLEKAHDTSEFLPAYDPYISFISIMSDKKISKECAEALADEFLFELNSALGLEFTRNIRPIIEEEEYYNPYKDCNSSEEFFTKKRDLENEKIQEYNSKEYKLYPIKHGRGIHEAVRIFNKTITISDVDYKILNYIRVIEYISPTVARKELIDNVLTELSLRGNRNINADFVLLLGENYKKYDTMRDKDLCRTAIKAINFDCIADSAPEYMKRWADWHNPPKQKEVMIRIADTITATRNEIAHAKANYQKCGLECPEKYKDEFVVMMQKTAELLIRWYSQQPEKTRICN